jgi:anti-sigma-K factor RskA
MTHAEQSENIGAYALGALPELEARLFERHLMGCEACQDELQRLQQAADALPRSVTPYEAPPSLKASLMDVVNAEAAAGGVPRAEPRAAKARVRGRWLPRVRPAFAFAAAAAAIALAFYGGTRLDGDGGSGDPRTVAAEVDGKRMPDGSASLLIPENDDRGAVLRVQGLPDPGRGRVYQVWVQRGGEVVPVSIFGVDSRGAGAAAIPESLEDVSAVMVTRERDGGAKAPTEVPVLRVSV